MTRERGELPTEEEELLGIERPSLEDEQEAERLAAEKAELMNEFLRNLMTNQLFRYWLISQINAFGGFENTFAATPTGFPDTNATWFKAGMKAAGWALWEQFDDLAPELASLMRKEGRGPAPG